MYPFLTFKVGTYLEVALKDGKISKGIFITPILTKSTKKNCPQSSFFLLISWRWKENEIAFEIYPPLHTLVRPLKNLKIPWVSRNVWYCFMDVSIVDARLWALARCRLSNMWLAANCNGFSSTVDNFYHNKNPLGFNCTLYLQCTCNCNIWQAVEQQKFEVFGCNIMTKIMNIGNTI